MSDKNFKVKNGADIGGTVTATAFTGSGAGLTSVPNTALANKSITINGTSVDLGGTVTIPTGSAINPIFMIGGI